MRLCTIFSNSSDFRLNTFIGQLKDSTAWLGALHAFYGLGCAISPIVATRMVAAGLGWNTYYYVLLGWSILNSLMIGITYNPKFMPPRLEDAELAELPAQDVSVEMESPKSGEETHTAGAVEPPPPKPKSPFHIVVTNRFCWLIALYLVLYLGLEISTGGWVVEFMIQVYT
jgi:fucose permease